MKSAHARSLCVYVVLLVDVSMKVRRTRAAYELHGTVEKLIATPV